MLFRSQDKDKEQLFIKMDIEGAERYALQAVSYTHLDVYKRQPFLRPLACSQSRNSKFLIYEPSGSNSAFVRGY